MIDDDILNDSFGQWLAEKLKSKEIALLYLKQSNDVGEERQRFDLCAHKINKNFFVKRRRIAGIEKVVIENLFERNEQNFFLPMHRQWLQSDCGHDQRHEFSDFFVNIHFVNLVH